MATPELPTTLTLEIVTPDRSLFRGEVKEVQVPAAEGYMGILPGHTPLLANLQVGELSYRGETEEAQMHVALGFVEVLPDRVTVMAHVAERPDDIDVARAESARQRAEERLAKPVPDIDFERARISMMKSLIRLQIATRTRTRA
jgi:F-type H+-transporting ATPase subunit epsilon